jgi:alkylated DNA repair dioxygenase AlkB
MGVKPFAIALVLGISLLSNTAFALTQSKVGAVKSTNIVKRELVLMSGETFKVSHKIRLRKLKVGDRIKVRYTVKDGKLIASKVSPAR